MLKLRRMFHGNAKSSSPFTPQCGAADPPDVEVLHVDVPVGGGLPLAPQQQTLLSRGLCDTRNKRFYSTQEQNITPRTEEINWFE